MWFATFLFSWADVQQAFGRANTALFALDFGYNWLCASVCLFQWIKDLGMWENWSDFQNLKASSTDAVNLQGRSWESVSE